MENKNYGGFGPAAVMFLMFGIFFAALFFDPNMLPKRKTVDQNIPTDYIAEFCGGSGEMIYSTYIYKIDNDHDNMGFTYINATHAIKYSGTDERMTTVTSKGEVTWTDDVFPVAKKNKAYDYVKIPGDDKEYTIEEFQKMFIMN